MRHVLRTLAILSAFTFLTPIAALYAQQIGDEVIAVRSTPKKCGNEVVGTLYYGSPAVVDVVNGDWLWVCPAPRGWVQRGDVLPLDQAIQYFTDQIAKNPTNNAAFNARGIAWTREGEFDKGIADFNEAIRLDPSDASAYQNRGAAREDKGESDQAIADYSEAIRLGLTASAYQNRGVAREDKGDYDQAIDDYTEAIRLDPAYEIAYYNRGDAWERKGDYAHAIADYTEVIRLDSNFAGAYQCLAWLQSTCPDVKYRDRKEALKNATQAYRLAGEKDWNAIGVLAAAYAENGDFDAAVKWVTQALTFAEKNPTATPTDIQKYRSCLALYKAKKPYRDEIASK
jgi:tetratricopeptide (TPR) repeat protein